MDEIGNRPRRRGRPRKGATGDARARIADAAAAEFAEKGYDAASIRGIARRAEVDSALVHHYFESKAGLFAEVIDVPVRPDRIVSAAMDAPRSGLGESLARAVFSAWDKPNLRPIAVTMMRTALGSTAGSSLIRQFLLRELVEALAKRLRTDPGIEAGEARVRAELAMSQMAGVLMMRYVLGVEPLATLPLDALIARIAPVLQAHFDGTFRADS
ncbi:DNA-binding transcriptional regulator, AcrR family [Paramicrobacterium humi]|uniref:DNA-binding transcriptional regulator, AcrR family n=1 Tax=Paramicrobacterium humi TaxID=640635 RepID=A0A1H4JTH3_9MICO|nr:TetR family transcriptional regulator [Microbacterium humi]SEB49427.1 DNA-binding transcriptional regulator, AcrR family [Microbacterium humi]